MLEHEGGYVNDPKDSGGETNYGITKVVARASGFKGDMMELTENQAIQIYEDRYWTQSGCHEIAERPKLQAIIFDHGVNAGPLAARRLLQALVGVKKDGKIGPNTRRAIKRCATRFANCQTQIDWTEIRFLLRSGKKAQQRCSLYKRLDTQNLLVG